MKTLLLSAAEIGAAAEILRRGGIVGMPTETVYGLGASAWDEAAVARIFEAKGRPQDNPLIVHIAGLSALDELAAEVPDTARELARRFWPGPFTMVFPKKPSVPDRVTAGMDTVAVRFTAHPLAQELIRRAGVPIAAPSANVSGYPSPTCAAHVLRDLGGRIDAVIDGGPCACGVESTVVSVVGPRRLLRPGSVTLEQLRTVVPDIAVDKALRGEVGPDEKVSAPGMKYRHYAPKAPVIAVGGDRDGSALYIRSRMGGRDLCLCYEECAGIFAGRRALVYGSLADRASLARGIFAALRDADRQEPETIYVQCPDEAGVGLAVSNRIRKAAGFREIVADRSGRDTKEKG